jgi:hypothetical protein
MCERLSTGILAYTPASLYITNAQRRSSNCFQPSSRDHAWDSMLLPKARHSHDHHKPCMHGWEADSDQRRRQPAEARTGNQMMYQHELPVSRWPSVPLSWDWCTRYGRQRRSTFVVLSVYRFPCGRYGNGAYDHMWELVGVAQFASALDRILQEHVGTLVEVAMFASVEMGTNDWA